MTVLQVSAYESDSRLPTFALRKNDEALECLGEIEHIARQVLRGILDGVQRNERVVIKTELSGEYRYIAQRVLTKQEHQRLWDTMYLFLDRMVCK